MTAKKSDKQRVNVNDIKDHDHQMIRVEKHTYPDLGGSNIKKVCRDDDCDYFRSEWQENQQAGLQEFANT